MALSQTQIDYILALDAKGQEIMADKGEEGILLSLCDEMHPIKDLIDQADPEEIAGYCNNRSGFHMYINMLEAMAKACRDGTLDELICK